MAGETPSVDVDGSSQTDRRLHAVGVDLAWGDNPSGLAHMTLDATDPAAQWRLQEVRTLGSVSSLVAWITSRVPADAAVRIAVDAPLLATNGPGTQRAADQQLSNEFRRFRITALPVDQRHATRGAQLREALEEHDVWYAVPRPDDATRRGIFETFPTAAQLSLFELHRPIRYKSGSVEMRREGMRSLQTRLALLDDAALPLADTGAFKLLLREDPQRLAGAGLKDMEDRLDGFLCALVAALAWNAPGRLRTYGDTAEGFITVPHPPPAPGATL